MLLSRLVIMRLSNFLAARRRARGQPHDTHAVDRVHYLGKRDFFGLKPVGKDVLWSAPVNPASEEVGSVDPLGISRRYGGTRSA